jgi:crotonobetainyl-CoA:carnitine CoA-transferase CaiB-like acyl-CoA transferase
MEALQAAGVAAGAMLRVAELLAFDYYRQRGTFRQTRHPHLDEPLIVEVLQVRSTRMKTPPLAPAPLMAQHSREIVGQRLGRDSADLDALIAAGALEENRDMV